MGDTFVINGTVDFASMPQGAQIFGGGGFTDQVDVLKVEGQGADLNLGELFQDAMFNGGGYILGIELVDLTAAGSQSLSGVTGLAAFYLASFDNPDSSVEANPTFAVKGTSEDTVSLAAPGIGGETWTQGGQVTGGSGTVYNTYTSTVDLGAPVPTVVTMLVQQEVNVVMG